MRYLLDTQLLLWAAGDSPRLPAAVRTLLLAAEHDFLFSAASIWEVVIKGALGREDFKVDANRLRRGLLANGYAELAISSEHALAVAGLPPLHGDPFDRILAAQSKVESLPLLTADAQLAAYATSGAPIQLNN